MYNKRVAILVNAGEGREDALLKGGRLTHNVSYYETIMQEIIR